jgi:hypothetical protein
MKNDILKINYNKEIDAVVLEWITAPISSEFREGLTQGLELLKSTNAKNWIGDVRNLGAIDPDDQKWSNEEWFPLALSNGLKKMGVIISDDIFNQMSVDEIMSKVEGAGFASQYFDDIDKATQWMKI